MISRMKQQDGRPLEDWVKHYELTLTRLGDDWSPLTKNDSRYEVINLASVWKYFRNQEHNRSKLLETGTVQVEFHRDDWDEKFNDKKIHELLHDKKLYAMELLLQEYLNRFVIEINEWEDDE